MIADETPTTPAADAAPETPKPERTERAAPFKRPDSLYFVGALSPTGEPVEHLAGYGWNAADYPPGDPMLARKTDDEIEFALASKLYQRSKPKNRDENGEG